jgi:hypothetical protein
MANCRLSPVFAFGGRRQDGARLRITFSAALEATSA